MNNLLMEVENEVAVVTINRPKSLNALNSETLAELDQCFGEIAERKDIRVVILTGSGTKAFVAGADISEMVNATPAEGRKMGLLAKEAFLKLETMPQVTIAAVNGYALGGGCEISMACDIRVASDNAKFGQPETGLGILPGFGGTQRLPRLVGKGRAKELIFTCDQIDAQEAYRIRILLIRLFLRKNCLIHVKQWLRRSCPRVAMLFLLLNRLSTQVWIQILQVVLHLKQICSAYHSQQMIRRKV